MLSSLTTAALLRSSASGPTRCVELLRQRLPRTSAAHSGKPGLVWGGRRAAAKAQLSAETSQLATNEGGLGGDAMAIGYRPFTATERVTPDP